MEGFFCGALEEEVEVGRAGSDEEDWRAVIRVLTTQIGFVIRTVAEPAMKPAVMDSRVVSFLEARPVRRAARSKKERVHSYPVWREC